MNENDDLLKQCIAKTEFLYMELIDNYPDANNGDLMLIGALFMEKSVEIAHGRKSALLFEEIIDSIMPDILKEVKKYEQL